MKRVVSHFFAGSALSRASLGKLVVPILAGVALLAPAVSPPAYAQSPTVLTGAVVTYPSNGDRIYANAPPYPPHVGVTFGGTHLGTMSGFAANTSYSIRYTRTLVYKVASPTGNYSTAYQTGWPTNPPDTTYGSISTNSQGEWASSSTITPGTVQSGVIQLFVTNWECKAKTNLSVQSSGSDESISDPITYLEVYH
jgi:hypothetical protein